MCLLNTKFALKACKGEFIGTGYKLMGAYEIPKMRVWHKAALKNDANAKPKQLKTEDSENYDNPDTYRAGFHIFLKQEDAVKYQSIHPCYNVYEVKFKVVTAFGPNQLYADYSRADCVIAEYIKYEKNLGTQKEVIERLKK